MAPSAAGPRYRLSASDCPEVDGEHTGAPSACRRESRPDARGLVARVGVLAHPDVDGTGRNDAVSRDARTERRIEGIDAGPRTLPRVDHADPPNGIVRSTALEIVKGHSTPLAQARAIYDWIVDNTFRDPAVKGCGLGDIRWMLESRSFGGKCADLNALFVGLCRSAGLPARDLYGLRVGESRSFKSLGRSGDITASQHCRAEVYVAGIGWIPVDPADVRKVALEEEPGAPVTSTHVRRARADMFGSWEMNWIAFNDAHDVVLPGSTGKPLPFLMYPHAEVAGVRKDSLEPAAFTYRITAKEIL